MGCSLSLDLYTIILWPLWTKITKRAIINRSAVMTKLRRDEMVALPILDRICDTLNVDYGDIIEHVKEEGEKQNA